MPRGLRHVALSISFLSPIVRRPDTVAVRKIASLIFRPERRFLAVTAFQSLRLPSLSFGSSSLISLRRQSLSLSRARLRPPANIQSPSRFRLTSSTRPRFAATSFEDFAIPYKHHLTRFGRHQCRTRYATISLGVRLSDVSRSLVVERRRCEGAELSRWLTWES